MDRPSILIVEDEYLIGIDLRGQLIGEGFDAFGPIASGAEAIEQARKRHFDLVLMDIRLRGDMDGIETARRIQSEFGSTVAFTTGYNDAKLKDRAMAIRPLAWLNKPIGAREIVALFGEDGNLAPPRP